jgi:hypothetical protein
MERELSARIVDNAFLAAVRELEIDQEAYAALCADLRTLAEAWRGERLVDKALVGQLLRLLDETRELADNFESNDLIEQSHEVWGLWEGLHELVRACLQPESAVDQP